MLSCGVLRAIWTLGCITAVGLLYAGSRVHIAFPIAFTLIWALSGMMFWHRYQVWPAPGDLQAPKQDAMTFFGWFALLLCGFAAAGLWWAGAWK